MTASIFQIFFPVLDLYHAQFPQFHYIKYSRVFEIPRYNEYTPFLYFDDSMTKNVEVPISLDFFFSEKSNIFLFSEAPRKS